MKALDKLKNNKFIYIILSMIKRYGEHEVGATGASLAYFFILSIFPFLIFLNALLSIIDFSPEKLPTAFYDIVPREIIGLMQNYVSFIKANTSKGLFSFGIIATIFSASKGIGGVFKALEKSYDSINRKSGLYKQIESILATAIFGISILLCFITMSIGNGFWVFLSNYFDLPSFFLNSWNYVKWVIAFFTLFTSLGLLHYIIPEDKIGFKNIIPGTIFSIFTWISISYIFTYYIKNFSKYSEIYGSLGSIIILLLWLYLTGVVIVMGGELNHILVEIKEKENIIEKGKIENGSEVDFGNFFDGR